VIHSQDNAELIVRRVVDGVTHDAILGRFSRLDITNTGIQDVTSFFSPWRTYYDTGQRMVVAEIPGPVRLEVHTSVEIQPEKPKKKRRKAKRTAKRAKRRR